MLCNPFGQTNPETCMASVAHGSGSQGRASKDTSVVADLWVRALLLIVGVLVGSSSKPSMYSTEIRLECHVTPTVTLITTSILLFVYNVLLQTTAMIFLKLLFLAVTRHYYFFYPKW